MLSSGLCLALDPSTPLNQYRLNHWDNRSGLPQNGVGAITQTTDGYLWLGTQAGLARFDGTRFEHFIPATHPALRDSLINSLAAAPDGSLWIQSPNGIQRYANGRFESPIWPGTGRRLVTVRLRVTRDGAVWSKTADLLIRYKDARLRTWKQGEPGGLPPESGILREDPQGNVWLPSKSALYRLEGERFVRQPIQLPPGEIGDIAFSEDTVIVLIKKFGILRVNRTTGKVESTLRPPPGLDFGSLLYMDRHGTLWLHGNDTAIVRATGNRMETLKSVPPIIPDVLFEDREGNLWASGLANGLTQIADTVVQNLASPEAHHNTVWSLHEDRQGTLWIGGETGLSAYRDGVVKWIPELAGKRVAALMDHPSGLLAGTSKGVYLLAPGGARMIDTAAAVRDIRPLRDGKLLWVESGLWLRNGLSGEKRRLDDAANSWSPIIVPVRSGDGYWVAGRNRVGRVSSDGTLTLKPAPQLHEVTGLVEESPGDGKQDPVLWLSDFGGHLWLLREGKLTQVPLRPDLRITDAVSLLDDGMNRLWMGTSNGVLVFAKQDLVRAASAPGIPANGLRMGLAHGMRNPECNTLTNSLSATRTRNGKLWFATEGGAAGIDPRQFTSNPHIPAAQVEEILFDGVPQNLTSGVIDVGPGNGSFEFRYAGVTMVSPELVRFRYKLVGFDRDFISAGNRRSAFYTNLPPGKYRFVVEAANSDGLAASQPTALDIRLRPRLYQAEWFQVLCLLGAIGAIGAAFRWRLRAIKTRNAELEQAVALRTEELRVTAEEARKAAASKSDFLAMMSHEIRTPMNGVIGMTSLLLSMQLPAEAVEYLVAIRSSGRALLGVINDILDFSKVESGMLELERLPFRLDQCVDESLELMAPMATEKGLDLASWIDPAVPLSVVGDVTRLRQILLNLIGNAVKFTAAGEVVVTVGPVGPGAGAHPGAILVSVRDTGVGIPAERLDRLFKPFSQIDSSTTRQYGGTGLGLAISRRLCELMGGRIWVNSVEGSGSEFSFTLQLEPGASPAITPASLAAEQKPLLAGRRILIVDNECASRAFLARQLELGGARTEVLSNSTDALTRAAQQPPPDLILTSQQLGDEHGFHLARKIRALPGGQRIKLVLLLSQATQVELPLFDVVLAKPLKPARLFQALHEAFGDAPESGPAHVREPEFDASLAVRIPLRILLAEDNAVNQWLALRMLEKMGYRADVAANGVEVLAAMGRQTYDVILMDVQMPMMDGLEASRLIRAEWPGSQSPRIIAMTANAIAGDRELCLQAGMDDYVSKPIDVASLQNALKRSAKIRVA